MTAIGDTGRSEIAATGQALRIRVAAVACVRARGVLEPNDLVVELGCKQDVRAIVSVDVIHSNCLGGLANVLALSPVVSVGLIENFCDRAGALWKRVKVIVSLC